MTKEEVFKEMKNELVYNKAYYKEAVFKCFSDEIFTYEINTDTKKTEVNIIADDMFFAREPVIELFEKKRIGFFEVSIYDNEGLIWQEIYRPLGECEVN